MSRLDRRQLLQRGGLAALGAAVPFVALGQSAEHQAMPKPETTGGETADYTIRIGQSLVIRIGQSVVELAPETTISTKTYNGQFPGPLLGSPRGSVSSSTSTTTRIHQSSCIGTANSCPLR